MALIICPECGHSVSDKAAACPHCGYPLPSYQTDSAKIEPCVPVTPVEAELAPYKRTVPPAKKQKTGVIVAAVLSVLLSVVFVFWLSREPQEEKDYKAEVEKICTACGIKVESVTLSSSYAGGEKRYSVSVSSESSAPASAADLYGIAVNVAAVGWGNENIKAGFPTFAFQDCTYTFQRQQAFRDGRLVYQAKDEDDFQNPFYEKSDDTYNNDDIKAGVYVLAQKCVKNHLKAPSTAKFSEMWECAFQKGEGNVYMMTGYVDSQNSYGAMLQEQWSIMAEVNGDKVSLVMLTIGDQVYFD